MRFIVLLFCMVIAITICNARTFRDLRVNNQDDKWNAGVQWNDDADDDSDDDTIVIEPSDIEELNGSAPVDSSKFCCNLHHSVWKSIIFWQKCFIFIGRECLPDQEYQECGSACSATCDNRNPKACTLQCVPQCVCRDNLVRRGDGACVTIDKCTLLA